MFYSGSMKTYCKPRKYWKCTVCKFATLMLQSIKHLCHCLTKKRDRWENDLLPTIWWFPEKSPILVLNTTRYCLNSEIERDLVVSVWYSRRYGLLYFFSYILKNLSIVFLIIFEIKIWKFLKQFLLLSYVNLSIPHANQGICYKCLTRNEKRQMLND